MQPRDSNWNYLGMQKRIFLCNELLINSVLGHIFQISSTSDGNGRIDYKWCVMWWKLAYIVTPGLVVQNPFCLTLGYTKGVNPSLKVGGPRTANAEGVSHVGGSGGMPPPENFETWKPSDAEKMQ